MLISLFYFLDGNLLSGFCYPAFEQQQHELKENTPKKTTRTFINGSYA